MNTIVMALDLFKGRYDALGTEEGGAIRHRGETEQLWRRNMIEHFVVGGTAAVGVYPMVYVNDGWHVHWGCIDFDEGEQQSLEHAHNVTKVLWLAAGITGYVERSRSKGYHVWVFARDWVPAETMRRALLAACQIVDAPTKEINPKQTTLGWDEANNTYKLGNYVRLPYPGSRCVPPYKRCVEGEGGWWFPFHDFINHACETRSPTQRFVKMASRYVEPARRSRSHTPINTDLPWRDRLDRYSSALIFGSAKVSPGPLEGQDRSSWLWKLTNKLVEANTLTEEEMRQALMLAHDTHTPDKFEGRLEEEIDRMLDKALEQHD